MQMPPEILTHEGHYFNFLTPETSKFSIRTIAHALSNICRFNGHTRAHYSVAEHCVHVARLCPDEHKLSGLLHDAAEAFVGDVASPLKQLLPEYKVIEQRVEAEIFKRFALPSKLHQSVKHADLVMLATERRDLMPAKGGEWGILLNIRPSFDEIKTPWTPAEAYDRFISTYRNLTLQ